MAEFLVTIADSKADLFLQLMKNLKFVKKVDIVDNIIISKKTKNDIKSIDSKAINKSKTKLDWKDVQNDFVLD